jgi:hypothetical protein
MGMIDKLNACAQLATALARETVHEAQLNQELGNAYSDLGHIAFGLLQQGAITDERLVPFATRIHDLEAELAALMPAVNPRDEQ